MGGSSFEGLLDVWGLIHEWLDCRRRASQEATEDAFLYSSRKYVELPRFLCWEIRAFEYLDDVFDEAKDAIIWSLNSRLG